MCSPPKAVLLPSWIIGNLCGRRWSYSVLGSGASSKPSGDVNPAVKAESWDTKVTPRDDWPGGPMRPTDQIKHHSKGLDREARPGSKLHKQRNFKRKQAGSREWRWVSLKKVPRLGRYLQDIYAFFTLFIMLTQRAQKHPFLAGQQMICQMTQWKWFPLETQY